MLIGVDLAGQWISQESHEATAPRTHYPVSRARAPAWSPTMALRVLVHDQGRSRCESDVSKGPLCCVVRLRAQLALRPASSDPVSPDGSAAYDNRSIRHPRRLTILVPARRSEEPVNGPHESRTRDLVTEMMCTRKRPEGEQRREWEALTADPAALAFAQIGERACGVSPDAVKSRRRS